MHYDVVISGASIAGCTAAMLYGRAGLRVALLERNRSADAHKALCGHFILGGTRATLERLGLWDELLTLGAATSDTVAAWTPAGWIVPAPDSAPSAVSIRRSLLDPRLRGIAAATPGVDLFLGHSVTGILEEGRTVTGVVATARNGQQRPFSGRLVVGADGHRSPLAGLAGVQPDTAPNQRFLLWAYYRGVDRRAPGDAQIWLLDRDVAVCDSTDAGLTQIGVFPSKRRLAEFEQDRLGAFERFVAGLPDGPSLHGADRVSKLIGTTDYPCVRRHPAPRPGLALVGDAATASDPVPAVGCGWAFRSAESLADATIPALTGHGDVQRALREYRRAHRLIEQYDKIGRADARALPPNAIQRAIFHAAARDPELAGRMARFAMRAGPPSVLRNPGTIVRAVLVRSRRTRPARRPVALSA